VNFQVQQQMKNRWRTGQNSRQPSITASLLADEPEVAHAVGSIVMTKSSASTLHPKGINQQIQFATQDAGVEKIVIHKRTNSKSNQRSDQVSLNSRGPGIPVQQFYTKVSKVKGENKLDHRQSLPIAHSQADYSMHSSFLGRSNDER
jgi:hypothetical protein